MRLRDWILGSDEEASETGSDEEASETKKTKVEEAAEKSIVDPDVYSEDEILRDKVRLKDQRKQAEQDLAEYRENYKNLIEAGQRDDISDDRRKDLAHRASMVKNKYKTAKQKLADIRMELAVVVAVEGVREILSIAGRSHRTKIGELIEKGELATEQVDRVMEEIRVKHGVKREEMENALSSLDVDMMPQDSQLDETPEYEIMKEGAAEDIEAESLLEDQQEDQVEYEFDEEFDDSLL